MFSTLFRYQTVAFLVVCSLIPACVSKGKYYDTLQKQASATTELGITRIDLEDARKEILRQEALILGLRDTMKVLDTSVSDLSKERKNEQRQIGASLNKTAEEVSLCRNEVAELNRRLAVIQDYFVRKNERLSELSSSFNGVFSTLPQDQFSSSQKEESLQLSFGEGLLFVRSGSTLSDFGEGLLKNLGKALSTQGDLLIEVIAYPTVPVGSMKAWSSASARANTIANTLVINLGLSPKQISSTSKQGEIIVLDGAPAESKLRKTVEIIIRLNPDEYPLPDWHR